MVIKEPLKSVEKKLEICQSLHKYGNEAFQFNKPENIKFPLIEHKEH